MLIKESLIKKILRDSLSHVIKESADSITQQECSASVYFRGNKIIGGTILECAFGDAFNGPVNGNDDHENYYRINNFLMKNATDTVSCICVYDMYQSYEFGGKGEPRNLRIEKVTPRHEDMDESLMSQVQPYLEKIFDEAVEVTCLGADWSLGSDDDEEIDDME